MHQTETLLDSPQSAGAHAILLFKQARAAGEEQVKEFLQTIDLAVEQARWIIDGGDVYPAGVRDACEKLSEHMICKAQTIASLPSSDGVTKTLTNFTKGADQEAPAPVAPAPAEERSVEDNVFSLDLTR